MIAATTAPAGALGPVLVGALLLIIAGAAKLVRPRETALALRLSGVPVGSRSVRAGALVEVALASAAIVTGAPGLCVAVGLSYVAFAAFVTVALVRGLPLSSCGCLGEPDAPPTIAHIGVDLVLAGGAFWAARSDLGSPLGSMFREPAWGVALVAGVGLVVWLCILALTALAQLGAESRRAAVAVLGDGAARRVTP